jgi:hypothetical protein
MYRSIDEIRAKNITGSDRYWFSPRAMRFFDSRVSGDVYQGAYFISSEKGHGPRAYSISQAQSQSGKASAKELFTSSCK